MLSLNKMDSNQYQQGCAGASGCAGDDGGHLIASALGGAGDRVNIVPQASTLNRGEWKAMENELAGYLKEGKSVSVKIEVGYPAGGGSGLTNLRSQLMLTENRLSGNLNNEDRNECRGRV